MSDDFTKSVGERIRTLRQEKGLTQAEFAEAAGMNRRYVSTMEAGDKALSLKTLGRAALVLGTTPSALLEGLMPDASTLEPAPRRNARPGAPRRSS